MNYENEQIVGCAEFEDNLSDYLEKTLDRPLQKAMAEHALKCPLCHTLLNEVKDALEVCHELNAPQTTLTSLEARILNATVPELEMSCKDFEEHLTDYLDGFLPAKLFHRWERHAVVCNECTDLPGEVVRSIAACYTYKLEELPLPEGLHDRILQKTIGTTEAETVQASWGSRFGEWIRGLSVPISVPQLAPVAMLMLTAFLFFSQTTNNSVGGFYQKSFELAGQTYKQGADIIVGGKTLESSDSETSGEPAEGIFIKKGN